MTTDYVGAMPLEQSEDYESAVAPEKWRRILILDTEIEVAPPGLWEDKLETIPGVCTPGYMTPPLRG